MQARLARTDTQATQRKDTALIALRTQLEAKLLAHRCGWQALDDIRVKRLELALKAVLAKRRRGASWAVVVAGYPVLMPRVGDMPHHRMLEVAIEVAVRILAIG